MFPYEGDKVKITKGAHRGKHGIVKSYTTVAVGLTYYDIEIAPGCMLTVDGDHLDWPSISKSTKQVKEAPPCCKLTTPHQHCNHCTSIIYFGDYPFCPHDPIRQRDALTSIPTVYWENAKGEKLFGLNTNEKRIPRGYARVEVPYSQRKTFYRELSTENRRKFEASQERQHLAMDAAIKEKRSNLLRRLQTPVMREAAIKLFEKHDREREADSRHSDGVYVEAWEMDRSNRDAHYRDDGTRGRD